MRKLAAFGFFWIVVVANFLQPAYAQGSGAEPWKNCQSDDADRRLAGCSAVIDAKGFGSQARLSDALDGRCWAYHVKGKYDLAVADCKASIALRPNYSYAYNNLGTAYLGLSDYPNALLALNRAIELKSNFAFSWLNRAKVFAALGRTEEARRDYQRVLALDPNNGEAKAALTAEAPVARPPVPGSPATSSLANAAPASAPPAPAAAPSSGPAPAALAASSPTDRRVALVIGNSAYQTSGKLPNAARDASAVADQLRQVGFQQVIQENDLTRDKLDNALRRFSRIADSADWAVIYYAGHGMEMSGVNYLIPVDAKMESDRDVDFESIPMGRVMTSVEGARKLKLVILDACRNNPFLSQMRRTGTDRSIGRGLARYEPSDAGSLVVYAAMHGEVAMDGDAANSPFAAALVKRIATPGLEVRRLFDVVRDDVLASTNRRQRPFTYGSLSGSADFYFVSK